MFALNFASFTFCTRTYHVYLGYHVPPKPQNSRNEYSTNLKQYNRLQLYYTKQLSLRYFRIVSSAQKKRWRGKKIRNGSSNKLFYLSDKNLIADLVQSWYNSQIPTIFDLSCYNDALRESSNHSLIFFSAYFRVKFELHCQEKIT